jgi:hypothetical protein
LLADAILDAILNAILTTFLTLGMKCMFGHKHAKSNAKVMPM